MSSNDFNVGAEVKIINIPGLNGDIGTIISPSIDNKFQVRVNHNGSFLIINPSVDQLTLLKKVTLLTRDSPRRRALKKTPKKANLTFVLQGETPTETEQHETSTDEILSTQQVKPATLEQQVEALSLSEKKREDKRIYFVLIRAHSGIPLKKTKNPEKVHTVTPPEEMTVYKITSALNGLRNCGNLNYEEKKNTIQNSIKKYYDELHGRSLPDIASVCFNIQQDLKKIEKPFFTKTTAKSFGTFEERNIISTGKFINKQFKGYKEEERPELFSDPKTSYKVIDCFYYDIDNTNPFVQNGHFEYNDVLNEIFAEERFNIKDILTELQELNIHNVVLLDFGCSSYQNKEKLYTEKELDELTGELTTYLNAQNLHGGIDTKRHKKYKTRKSKKTRKSIKKRKTRKNYAL